jgi:hypothetical protein
MWLDSLCEGAPYPSAQRVERLRPQVKLFSMENLLIGLRLLYVSESRRGVPRGWECKARGMEYTHDDLEPESIHVKSDFHAQSDRRGRAVQNGGFVLSL